MKQKEQKIKKATNKSSGRIQKQKIPKSSVGKTTTKTKKKLANHMVNSIEQEMMAKCKAENKPLNVLGKKSSKQKKAAAKK